MIIRFTGYYFDLAEATGIASKVARFLAVPTSKLSRIVVGNLRWSAKSGQAKVATSSTHDHKEEPPQAYRLVQDAGGARSAQGA